MVAGGDRLAVAVGCVALLVPGPVAAQESGAGSVSKPASVLVSEPASEPASVSGPASAPAPAPAPASVSVLVTPVQGNGGLREEYGERVAAAVRQALVARGYQAARSQDLLGQAVVACQTPECVEQALDAAGAAFAIVPAVWVRESGGEELTLTLVQKSGRNLNVRGVVGEDLPGAAANLVDELLTRQAAAASAAIPVQAVAAPAKPAHPHAWKAGPIILIAGGAGAVIAVGVAAGIRNDTQQLNTGAVAAWSAIGAAAIAGGVAWWVVGEKRHRSRARASGAPVPIIAFRPTGIDLRLRF